MRRVMGLIVGTVAFVAVFAAPSGAAVKGSTSVGDAIAGSEVTVTASITSPTPIAPYEYSIENKCWFSGRPNGHFDSSERFDLAGPWFDAGGVPTTTVSVNLNDVPAGAVCKVSIAKGPTLVKGSTSSYAVVEP